MPLIIHVHHGDEKIELDSTLFTSVELVAESGGHTDAEKQITLTDLPDGTQVLFAMNADNVTARVSLPPLPTTKEKVGIGETLMIRKSPLFAITVYAKLADAEQTVDFADVQRITIGRSSQNDVCLVGAQVSGKHAEIAKQGDELILTDVGSTNGTFLNNRKIKKTILRDGDIIAIAGYKLVLRGSKVHFENVGNELSLNFAAEEPPPDDGYPYFQKSTRLLYDLPSDEVEIQAPPHLAAKPEKNALTSVLPSLAMLIPMIIGFFTGPMGIGLLSAPSLIIGVVLSIYNYRKRVSTHSQSEQKRLDKYSEYLKQTADGLSIQLAKQRDTLNAVHPPLRECFEIAALPQRRLWERTPGESDFLTIRLGLGEAPFGVRIKTPKRTVTIEDDSLASEPDRIAEHFRVVKNVPVCLSIAENPTIGIVGDRAAALQVAKGLLVQAATHHSYDSLKLVTLFTEKEEAEWKWMRWLPHSWDDGRARRYMAVTRADKAALLKELEEILKQRERDLKEEGRYIRSMALPYLLFVITDRAIMENETIMRYILQNNPDMGVGAIMLFDELGNLPSDCKMIVETRNGTTSIYNRASAGNPERLRPDSVTSAELDAFARALAPVRLAQVAAESKLPGSVTFLQGYGVKKAEELDLAKRWGAGATHKSMSVPIGVKSNGDAFCFDIHEKAHGPHGLVAGMTGSGKSEMVQSWILSMALHFTPQEVSFVLIDFKGTGLILPFANMPHLAGTISDLDTDILRNLISLENELSRRKAILDKYGVNNINNYLKLYREGKTDEPLPLLFVVVDEYAEFKVQFPDFLPVVNRIFAIGRTLGVFTLLLTQKPSGVVDDKMNANTRFRWCLKVASSADSKEMLKHPDAAKITVPGRGYVQVGEDEIYELVQTYWSGAPYNPTATTRVAAGVPISAVELNGTRRKLEHHEKVVGAQSGINEIDAVVSYIADYAATNGVPRARSIWLPRMEAEIPLESLLYDSIGFDGETWHESDGGLAPIIGMVDNPRAQAQYPLRLDLAEHGHIALYGLPRTGKTTFLQTLIISLARTYSPEDVNIYIMDFNSKMGILEGIPHIGGIADGGDEERIEKLVRLLLKELDERKRKFAKVGAQSLAVYREATGERLPPIVLILDDFTAVYELFPGIDTFFLTLTQQGGSYGMYFVVTTGNTMSLGFKLAQNIKMMLALELADKGDYTAIVGKTEGLVPQKFKGRGLIKNDPPLEIQIALPLDAESDTERTARIKALCAFMRSKWTGNRVAAIPIMPEIITHDSIAREGLRLPVGLGTLEVDPMFLNLGDAHGFLVSGTRRSGKSTMLKVLATHFKTLDNATLAVFDSEQAGLASLAAIADNYITDAAEFDEYIASLIPLLQERREQYGNDHTLNFAPVAIVIDDLKSCFESAREETINRLEAILRIGKGLNVNLFVAGQCEDVIRLHSQVEKLTVGLVGSGVSVLLGGKFNSHGVFTSSMSYGEKETELGTNEGYLLRLGNSTRFKAMYID